MEDEGGLPGVCVCVGGGGRRRLLLVLGLKGKATRRVAVGKRRDEVG